jgi:hypothetical protein
VTNLWSNLAGGNRLKSHIVHCQVLQAWEVHCLKLCVSFILFFLASLSICPTIRMSNHWLFAVG